jgi:palmitoyltransferase
MSCARFDSREVSFFRKVPNESLMAWFFYCIYFITIQVIDLNVVLLVFNVFTLTLMYSVCQKPGYLQKSNPDNTPDTSLDLSQAQPSKADLRYCEICEIHQPLRTKHCHESGKCVATFDHYCFWLGGPVGELNHRVFVFMIIFTALCATWNASILLRHLQQPFLHSWKYYTSIGLFILGGIFPVVLSNGLFVYHLYLTMTAQTTWEHLATDKITYLNKNPPSLHRANNPFNKGILNNLAEFWWKRNTRNLTISPIIWVLNEENKESNGCTLDTIFDNQFYSCC